VSILDYQTTSLPADPDAERSILGAILLDAKAYDEASARGLTDVDFSLSSHQQIYLAMQSMAESGRPIDMVTLGAELDSRRQIESVGGYTTVRLNFAQSV
jgi:replicative DNA helicase